MSNLRGKHSYQTSESSAQLQKKWMPEQNRALELRVSALESLERHPGASGYYERWLAAFETLIIEKDLLTKEEMDARTAELAKAVSTPRPRSLMDIIGRL